MRYVVCWTWFLLLALQIAFTVAQQVRGSEVEGPRAEIVLKSGAVLKCQLSKVEDGVLLAKGVDGELRIPLAAIKTIVFTTRDSRSPEQSTPAPPLSDETNRPEVLQNPIRIAVVDIELDTKKETQRRLDRIGANYELVPPDAPLDAFKKYQIVYFPHTWATLDGLGDLQEKFHRYVREGGSMLFAEPNTYGDESRSPALKLLPYKIDVTSHGAIGGKSVRAYTDGRPHPLMQGIDKSDLPYPHDHINDYDPAWTVLAKSTGSSPGPSLMVAEIGKGRVLLHTDQDDYGHQSHFKDRFVVRIIKWLAQRPDSDVQANAETLGPPRWPDYVNQLEKDYADLIAKEPLAVQEVVRRAERILRNDAQQSSTWTSYSDAIRLVRRNRTKAAIPMLLRLLADDRLHHNTYDDEVYDTFLILTGRPVMGKTVKEVAEQWWFPQRDEITVEPAEMKLEQRKNVVAKLLNNVPGTTRQLEAPDLGRTAYNLYNRVVLESKDPFDTDRWSEKDFPDALVPDVLAASDDPSLRFRALSVLTELRRVGRAPQLDVVIKDTKVSSAQRILAAVALWKADQVVWHEELIALLKTDVELELKLIAIITLGNSEHASAVETVFGYLNSKDEKTRDAAVWATCIQKTPKPVQPIAEALRRDCRFSVYGATTRVNIPGEIKTNESAAALAELMQMTLQERPQDDILVSLIDAFENVTDKKFKRRSNPRKQPEVIEAAREALGWWHSEGQ